MCSSRLQPYTCAYLNARPLWYTLWRVMKGQLFGRGRRSPKQRAECLWGMLGGHAEPGGGALSLTNRHTASARQRTRISSPARLHTFMCQLVITPRGLVFPDCSGLSETLRLTCITHSPDTSLCACASARACVRSTSTRVCATYLHLRLGNDSQPVINLSARLHDMSASCGGHFLSTRERRPIYKSWWGQAIRCWR